MELHGVGCYTTMYYGDHPADTTDHPAQATSQQRRYERSSR